MMSWIVTKEEYILQKQDPSKAGVAWTEGQYQRAQLNIKPEFIFVGNINLKYKDMKDITLQNVPPPVGFYDSKGGEYFIIRILLTNGDAYALRGLGKDNKKGNVTTQEIFPKLKGRVTHKTVEVAAVREITQKQNLLRQLKGGYVKPMAVGTFEVIPKGQKTTLQIVRGAVPGEYKVSFQTPGVVRQATEIAHKVDQDLLVRLMGKLDQISQAINVLRGLDENDPARAKMEKAHESLKKFGLMLYNQMIPPSLQRPIKELTSSMEFGLDESLVGYPWELLHDGEDFLCLQIPLGRYVASGNKTYTMNVVKREKKTGVKFLLIIDPDGSLPGARTEGETIKKELEGIEGVSVKTLVGPEADSMNVLGELGVGYDFLHYSGHAVFDAENPDNSGILLSDGVLKAFSIAGAVKNKPPIIAFINACESGKQADWTKGDTKYENQVSGLASAFLINGINFVGSMWPVYDDAALLFARNFYFAVLQGVPLGEAMLKSKKEIFDAFSGEVIAWASYSLYGDPTQTLEIKKM
jgi:CHAT domain-containing protein